MNDADLQAMRERDAKSAATWFTGPASGPAHSYRDRRALILHAVELRVAIAEIRAAGWFKLDDAALEKLDALLGIEKPTAPPIADFANRADPDEQQTPGENE